MFKKAEIKKALQTLCKGKTATELILKQKEGEEQSDASYVKAFAAKLYTDELMEYLNDEAISELKAIEFGNPAELGVLGECVVRTQADERLNTASYGNRAEKVCCVGYTNMTGEIISESENGIYKRTIKYATYMTEKGDILKVREVAYKLDDTSLLTVRTIDDTIEPSFGDIVTAFPENYRNMWLVR